jgi:hypothetical protein
VRVKDKTYFWMSVWWKTKNSSWGIYMSHIHCVVLQNKLEIPRDKNEVNNREIHECDGWEHDPDTMVDPLTTNPTHEVEVLVKTAPTIDSCREEDTELRKCQLPWYCSVSCILETKTRNFDQNAKIKSNFDQTAARAVLLKLKRFFFYRRNCCLFAAE